MTTIMLLREVRGQTGRADSDYGSRRDVCGESGISRAIPSR